MKRLYQPNEKDEISYEISKVQDDIRRLKAKPYLSEMEFHTLQMAQQRLRYLRSL